MEPKQIDKMGKYETVIIVQHILFLKTLSAFETVLSGLKGLEKGAQLQYLYSTR